MRIIDAAALVGLGVALARVDLALQGLQRFGIDLLLISGAGLLVFALKQAFVHRRSPL